MSIFEPGDVIKTNFGAPIKIVKYLAEGGQGEVYIVEYAGKKKALKWYIDAGRTPKEFYKNLKRNVDAGSPNRNFLWPEAITEEPKDYRLSGKNSFGYVMDLRPDGYYEMSNILTGKKDGKKIPKMSFVKVVDASLNIITAFRILHNLGYSYQDMNDGNFFINPLTGDVLVCDNDNVAPNKVNTGILGKPRYMAPELALDNGTLPDAQTDRYSLACVLFLLLCRQHPLEGEKWCVPCLTDENAQVLYGSHPVFICDPNDKSNGPVRGVHDGFMGIWKCLPDYMREAFCRAFGNEALHNPQRRLRELDWLKLYVRFRSEISQCSCGNEVFIKDAKTTSCDRCNKPIQVSHSFEFVRSKYSMAARHGARIYKCQIATCSAEDAMEPIAVVVANRSTGELGVMNKTNLTLEAITTQGNSRQVKSGEVMPFKPGITLKAFDGQVLFK